MSPPPPPRAGSRSRVARPAPAPGATVGRARVTIRRAPAQVTLLRDGRRVGQARQHRRGGLTLWRVQHDDVPAFDLEPQGRSGRRWLLTRTDGMPFASIHLPGGLRHRMELSDGRGLSLTVADGVVTDPHGRRLATVDALGVDVAELHVRHRPDARVRTLLVAAAVLAPIS